jgi:hypothetical protein
LPTKLSIPVSFLSSVLAIFFSTKQIHHRRTRTRNRTMTREQSRPFTIISEGTGSNKYSLSLRKSGMSNEYSKHDKQERKEKKEKKEKRDKKEKKDKKIKKEKKDKKVPVIIDSRTKKRKERKCLPVTYLTNSANTESSVEQT